MAQYWINSIEWQCESELPEETDIIDENKYPFILEARANASEEDIIEALNDAELSDDVQASVEGYYEFSIESVDYEPVEKNKVGDENFGLGRESEFRGPEEEAEDLIAELMEYLQTDFRDLKDLVWRGGERQDLAVQLIRKHLIPNLKELADLLDQR